MAQLKDKIAIVTGGAAGFGEGIDHANGALAAVAALAGAEMVISLSPFKANLDCADVLLPIAPFTETPGTFVNAEGRLQSFHAVVKPLGETRPGWKVLRVLANLLGLPGFDYESAQDVLVAARGPQDAGQDFVQREQVLRLFADEVMARL